MRVSQFFLSTLKESPADAEVISHQLMLRAGMIRRLAAGLYTWMPMGLRTLRKVENIIREEMNKAGATRFGSGWAWLYVKNGKLEVGSTPLMATR